MILRTLDALPTALTAEAVVIFRHGDDDTPYAELDAATGGRLAAVLASGDHRGKVAEVMVVQAPGQAVKRVAVAGLGKRGEATLETLRKAAGKAVSTLRDLGVTDVTLLAPAAVGWKSGLTPSTEAAAQAIMEGARLVLYTLDLYRKKQGAKAFESLTLVAANATDAAAVKSGVDAARILADAVDLARTLILHPSNVLTPARLADECRTAGEAAGLEVRVLDEKQIDAKGFTGISAIGRGSEAPARFITLKWNGGTAGEAPIAIVGKGVTFDTGGITIKPSAGMDRMKYDMGGAAAALGIVLAAAGLKLPLNVVTVIPAVENMPSATAVCPNEIVTMYNGLTVEINDTDAEGRVILADALAFAVKDLGAQAIVDMATLTGAIGVALGREICGVMGNHQGLVDAILAAGNTAGERGWQLPMFEIFDEATTSDIADLKNYPGRDAGAITAAAFLKAFVADTPWVHLDIAGVGWTDETLAYCPKGPTGAPIRTVIELLRNWSAVSLA